MKDNYKLVSICFFISSLCFYISSIFYFIDNNTSSGVLHLSLGSTFLCLGVAYLNKYKNEDKDNKK